jgi:hypothetical protein
MFLFFISDSERQEVFQAGPKAAFLGLAASEEDWRLLKVRSLFQGMAWIGMTYVYVPRLHVGEASRFFFGFIYEGMKEAWRWSGLERGFMILGSRIGLSFAFSFTEGSEQTSAADADTSWFWFGFGLDGGFALLVGEGWSWSLLEMGCKGMVEVNCSSTRWQYLWYSMVMMCPLSVFISDL